MEEYQDKIYFEPDGRMYRKEFFEKKTPIHIFIYGKFRGKFYADKKETKDEKSEYYDFKIYEGEVEVLYKDVVPRKFVVEKDSIITVNENQLPDKIYYYQKEGDSKVYYDLNLQNLKFYNFRFIELFQQNEENEAFGSVEGEVYGFITQYKTESRFRKRYKEIKLIKREREGERETEENSHQGKKGTFNFLNWLKIKGGLSWGGDAKNIDEEKEVTTKQGMQADEDSGCIFGILVPLIILIAVWAMFGFVPMLILLVIWLIYVVITLLLRWLKYLVYLLGILFLVSLFVSILDTDWTSRSGAYIPKNETKENTKPKLIKIIRLISDGKEDLMMKHQMVWYGYRNERYEGEYYIKQSDYKASVISKNALSYQTSYGSMLKTLSENDKTQLSGLYQMFDEIKSQQSLDEILFAEMVVSFVQEIPYHLIMQQSCNPNDYQERDIKQLIIENSGNCLSNQKFGITTPLEFMVTQKGDCDSRTLLLYTILKHYGYDVAIFSSNVYQHSILGIALPYNGLKYEIAGKKYTLWETTDKYKPGVVPLQIANLNYWKLTLN